MRTLIVYTMSVFDLSVGESGKVTKIDLDGAAGNRLQSLGLTVGGKVQLLGFSLFKSSVLLGIGQTRVAVRKWVAQKIEVRR